MMAKIRDRTQNDSFTHVYACVALCISVTTQMADVRLVFCVLLVVLIAAPDNRRRSFLFRFPKAERFKGGPPRIALDPLCLKEATLCLFSHVNLVLNVFANHKSDFGLSTFGCVQWSVVDEHPQYLWNQTENRTYTP